MGDNLEGACRTSTTFNPFNAIEEVRVEEERVGQNPVKFHRRLVFQTHGEVKERVTVGAVARYCLIHWSRRQTGRQGNKCPELDTGSGTDHTMDVLTILFSSPPRIRRSVESANVRTASPSLTVRLFILSVPVWHFLSLRFDMRTETGSRPWRTRNHPPKPASSRPQYSPHPASVSRATTIQMLPK